MDQALNVLKALAHESRLRIINFLMQENELCACEFIELLQLSGATVSRHMGTLIGAGLVTSRKDGRWVHYSLATSSRTEKLLKWAELEIKQSDLAKKDVESLETLLSKNRSNCGKGKES